MIKKILLGALFVTFSIIFSFSQSDQNNGRKGRINRSSGGFVKTYNECTLHSGRRCLLSNGYHEVTSYIGDEQEVFCTYKGGFLARRYQGQGEYHNADGSLDYVGTFQYGFFKTGLLTNKYGDTLSGTFKKEDQKWYLENGYISTSRWYKLSDSPTDLQRSATGDAMFVRGYVKDGQLHGHVYFKILSGIYQGTEFDGEFVEGEIKGCGIMKIFRTDDFLQPTNTNSIGCYIGFKSINPSGDIYMGQWDNCTYNGWGLLVSRQYAVTYGYWNNNQVSGDIPYSIVAQTLSDVCNFNYDLDDYSPTVDSNTITIIPTLPDMGDDGGYIVDVDTFTEVDNRGNTSSGIKIIHKINYLSLTVEGDYPPGKYNLSSSRNAHALLYSLDTTIQLLSAKMLDSLNYDLISPSSEITFKLTATTDIAKIRTKIPYIWREFGLDSVPESIVYTLDRINNYSIAHKIRVNEYIYRNSQLAYLRALGIKKFIEDSLYLNTQNINYVYQIDTIADYRAIGIEMFIENSSSNLNPAIRYVRKVETEIPSNSDIQSNSAAIIIYMTEYESNLSSDGLVYAETDAMLVKDYFEQTMGVRNIKVYKNNAAEISDINQIFNRKILELAKTGVTNIYLYYQGHGFADENQHLYLMPYNVNLTNEGNPIMDDIDSLTGYISKATKIVKDSLSIEINFYTIFDACASYTPSKGSYYVGRHVKNVEDENLCIISASQMFKTAALDHTLQHSLLSYGFCYALYDNINTDINGDGNLTFDEIFLATKTFVEEQTKQFHANVQIPAKYGQGAWDNKVFSNINMH